MSRYVVKAMRLVEEEELHEDDKFVPAETEVIIRFISNFSAYADAALDVFHNTIPVKNPEHFEFSVWKDNKGPLDTDDAHEYGKYIDAGYIC